jgi:ribose transport system substrate-binding protein
VSRASVGGQRGDACEASTEQKGSVKSQVNARVLKSRRGLALGAVVAAGAVAAFGGSSASAKKPKADYVIGVSNTLVGNGWREEMICAVKAQALASGKVAKVVVVNQNQNAQQQIASLRNLISQGVNAIIMNPADRTALNPVIKQAAARKIVVVAVDQAVSAPQAYVATNDQVRYGYLGALWLFKKIGGKGNVLYMRGAKGVPADTDRDKGFQQALKKYPNVKVTTTFTNWNFATGAQQAAQQIASGKHFDGVWTSGIDYTIVDAFKKAGQKVPPIVGADNNGFIGQLLKGTPGAVVTNPATIGGVGAAIAIQALEGKNPKHVVHLTPAVWDLQHNKADLKANYFPGRAATYSARVSIKPYTSYTPKQLFACKGPGD